MACDSACGAASTSSSSNCGSSRRRDTTALAECEALLPSAGVRRRQHQHWLRGACRQEMWSKHFCVVGAHGSWRGCTRSKRGHGCARRRHSQGNARGAASRVFIARMGCACKQSLEGAMQRLVSLPPRQSSRPTGCAWAARVVSQALSHYLLYRLHLGNCEMHCHLRPAVSICFPALLYLCAGSAPAGCAIHVQSRRYYKSWIIDPSGNTSSPGWHWTV